MAQSPSVVRPPAVKPSHHDQAKSLPSDSWNVAFRHPGYDDPNVLLQMPAIDPGGGVHHATALVACAIMADSQWDGYFTEDKEGQRKVDVSLDDILKGRNYYFHLPNTTSCQYPIVPTFNDYRFPHGNLPDYWRSCIIPKTEDEEISRTRTGYLFSRDKSCRITLHAQVTQTAHLIPEAEKLWFDRNGMFNYCAASLAGSPNDGRNLLLLRSDLHTLFGARRFAIVPKRASPDLPPTLVVHAFIDNAKDQAVQLYHSVALQPLSDVAVEFLFARFAWTIFPMAKFFLNGGGARELQVRVGNSTETRTFSEKQCREIAISVGSRNTSPKKRRKGTESSQEEEEDEDEELFREGDRGRKRRRHSFATSGSTPSQQ